jgi:hypothetical protein
MGCDNWAYIVCNVTCQYLFNGDFESFNDIPIRLKTIYFGHDFNPDIEEDPSNKTKEEVLNNIFGKPVQNYYHDDKIYNSDDLSNNIIKIHNIHDIVLNRLTEIWLIVSNHIQKHIFDNIKGYNTKIDITKNPEYNVIAGNLRIFKIEIISKKFYHDEEDKIIKSYWFE